MNVSDGFIICLILPLLYWVAEEAKSRSTQVLAKIMLVLGTAMVGLDLIGRILK